MALFEPDSPIVGDPDLLEVEIAPTPPVRAKRKTAPKKPPQGTIPLTTDVDEVLSKRPELLNPKFASPQERAQAKARLEIVNPKYRTEQEVSTLQKLQQVDDQTSMRMMLEEAMNARAAEAQRVKTSPLTKVAKYAAPGLVYGLGLEPEDIGQFGNRVVRGAIKATADIPLGIGALSNELAYEAAQDMTAPLKKWSEQNFPVDGGASFWTSVLPEGLGSSIPFIVGGVLTRGGSLLSSAMLGAAQNAASTYEEARQSGFDDSNARQAAKLGALIGTSEAAGLGRSIDKFGLKSTILQRSTEILEEGGQELLNQWFNNINAAVVSGYDPSRPLEQGVAESALLGALTGGIFQGTSAAVSVMPSIKEQVEMVKDARQRLTVREEDSSVSDLSQIRVIQGRKTTDIPLESKPPVSLHITDRMKRLQERIDRAVSVKENVPDAPPEIDEQIQKLTTELEGVRATIDLDMTYDLLPGLKPGQSPVMVIPNWMLAAFYGKPVTAVMGVTLPPSLIKGYRERIIELAPSVDHAISGVQALNQIVEEGQQEGINTVALINRDYMATGDIRTIPHETFHAAQGKAAEVTGQPPGAILQLHGGAWARQNPYIKKIIQNGRANDILNPNVPNEDLLAVELPAYIMGGDALRFFDSEEDGLDFLMGYFNHIVHNKGPEALNAIEQTAKILPEMSEVIPTVRNTYAQWVNKLVDKGFYGREAADRLLQSLYPSTSISGTAPTGSTQTTGVPVSKGLGTETTISEPIAPAAEPATGNVAFAAQPPVPPTPPQAGDKVKITGYANEAEVVELLPDDYVKVKFPDGTIDEFEAEKVTSVTKTPKPSTPVSTQVTSIVTPPGATTSTKGVVPTIPGPMRIKKTNVFVNRLGPGSSPGSVKIEFGDGTVAEMSIDEVRSATGKKIKDPLYYMLVETPPDNPTPPPNKPNNPALPPGGPYPPLFTQEVAVGFSKAISQQFSQLLENNNIKYDFSKPPSVQVYEALVEGRLREEDVENVLKDEDLEWEDFAERIYETYSRAGSTLQTLSEVVQRHWQRLKKENPGLFERLVAPSRQIQLMIDDLNETVLGMNLWKRSGRLFQKATLTQFGTAVNNLLTSVGRVPIDATAASLGQLVRSIVEPRQGTWAQRMEDSRNAAYETLMSGFEAWRALNPRQLQEVTQGRIGSEYAKYEEVVTQLEQYFPDIHAKLFARPLEMEAKELVKGEDMVRQMNILLYKVQNTERRRDLQQQVNKLHKALKRENSVLVKAGYRGPEFVYDQLLRPMQFGEFLMRRPRFVARLSMELKDRGINLNGVLRNSNLSPEQLEAYPIDQRMTFKTIPADAVKAAVSDALEFTMALGPSQGPDARYIEGVATNFIKMMNQLGPLAMMTDIMFPRAVYSAARTFYDYSPLPFFFEWSEGNSFRNISDRLFGRGKLRDPLTQAEYVPHPPTRADYDRLGRAMTGTFLYILATGLIHSGLIGDDWYQLKTGKKDKDGSPIYLDLRRWLPFARIFQLANLADRMATGRLNDVQTGVELTDIALGMKKYDTDPNLMDMIDATAEWWSGPERNPFKADKMQQMAGRFPGALMTPFLNLRSIVASYDEDENVRKDMRGYGFWGPSLDKLPWFRRTMPDLTYPTFEGKMKISEDPALQQLSLQFSKAPNFMGREFQRMGMNVREYLPKDRDPVIDAAQNEMFSYLIGVVGDMLENDENYRNSSNDEKAATWELYLMGDGGIAAAAKQAGLAANPMEAVAREATSQVPGKFTRKILGVTQQIEELRK